MVTDGEILETFDEIRGPYVTATELAERLPITKQQSLKRLDDLHGRDVIKRKQPVPQMVGWWIPDEDDD